MLALSGVVQNAGSVDDGDTVTDYLPAERERGITIQSAAVGFDWVLPASGKSVNVNLIDTPGHVDFSVEVHRSVAVLDGAVLVVDAVAGVQAQTETVWRAIRNTDRSSPGDDGRRESRSAHGKHEHEPLPAMMFINKMDREGSDFSHAINTVRARLRGSNPLPVQLPLYRVESPGSGSTQVDTNVPGTLDSSIVAGTATDPPPHGELVGLVDLVQMRSLVYPDNSEHLDIEDAMPDVTSLLSRKTREENPRLFEMAADARRELIASLAEADEIMEDLYLHAMDSEGGGDEDYDQCPILSNISTADIQSSLRRTTLERKVMPTMCGAALRGVGVEPVLDGVAELLPCPLDRLPPRLKLLNSSQGKKRGKKSNADASDSTTALGHPFHSSALAYVFKVVHMKGRGGSGDGRVAFARVYSGTLKTRDSVRVISPTADNGDADGRKQRHPTERIGGMLELSGGRFDNLPEGTCPSGDVCALVGLKGVVTGDTLLLTSAGSGDGDRKRSSKNDETKQYLEGVQLAGLTSPSPVLTVRVEAMSSSEQAKLSSALALLTVEDPSLVVEETPTTTLLSGLGELHIEIVLDRLRREFGVQVRTGRPAVTYREAVALADGEEVATDGLIEYDRTVGGVRMQGAVKLSFRPRTLSEDPEEDCIPPVDPLVTFSSSVREHFDLDPSPGENEVEHKYPPALKAVLSGVRGSLKRGRLGPYPLANLECHVMEVDSELSSNDTLPGAMRAAASNAVSTLVEALENEGRLMILEPKMCVEVSAPTEKIGDVLSDLTTRRGQIDDVAMGDEGGGGGLHSKSMIRAEVPLVEILGYANILRSLTGGEGAFSAEYKGHAEQEGS